MHECVVGCFVTNFFTELTLLTLACRNPIPLWVVITSIIGGVLAVGLGILLALKVVIMIMERIEYQKFLKDSQHVQWGRVRFFYH